MIAVDASALIAIALREQERLAFQGALSRADAAVMAPTNFLETGIVLLQRGFISSLAELEAQLAAYGVQLCEDQGLAAGALDAFMRYGKGRHPARLNLGDCFAYALAKQLDAPLLYKGDDFAQTDTRSALQPM